MLGVRQAAARSPSPDGAGIWCILLAAQRITRAFFLNGVAGLSLVAGHEDLAGAVIRAG